MSNQKEVVEETSEEERRNHMFSFIVGIFIAMGVIILLVILSLVFHF